MPFLRYHATVERRIRELGIGFTFLRPNLYFEGLLAFQPMIATRRYTKYFELHDRQDASLCQAAFRRQQGPRWFGG